MGDTTKRFEIAYRPEKFSEVLGQKPIVDELSALICRGKIGRNLLLAGDRGSGKTSLVRLYAKALSCENNDEDGSPCGVCSMCLSGLIDHGRFKRTGGLFEYDTAAIGGSKEDIARFLAAVRATNTPAKTRVVFFDEAHALESSDALLKEIEEGTGGIIYCFATTAPQKLGAPLLSRLWRYTVRALPNGLAVDLLRKVAREEKLPIDLEAIKLLAAVKRNYPRDLLIGLGQMASTGAQITVQSVKDAFGINQVDNLTAYFTALANGDKELRARAFADWNETQFAKAQWISAFLVSLYYNHVLGLTRVIDPLIHASSASHGAIVENWARRLCLHEAGLRLYWQRLLAFWSLHRPHDESTAALAIALFEAVADQRDVDVISVVRGAQLRSPNQPEGGDAAPSFADASTDPSSEFTTAEDVRLIVNRASFFAQQYGAYFDVSLEILPAGKKEDDAVVEIKEFCNEFAQHFANEATKNGQSPFAGIAFIERSPETGVYGLMTAYLGLDDDALGVATLNAYLEPRSSVRFEVSTRRSALKFHWASVLDLCASFEGPDGVAGGRIKLLDRLGVPQSRRRLPRPIRGRRISLFGAVTDQAIERAQEHKMNFLSAFDDRAFDWIRKGWESNEAFGRQREIKERKRLIGCAKELFAGDPEFLRKELDRLHASWPEDPKRRSRDWTCWWE